MVPETRTTRAWSPWLVGAYIGILSWIAFMFVGGPLSVTKTFESWGALLGRFFAPSLGDHPYSFAYLMDWRWAFVLGIPIGACLAAYLTGDRDPGSVPELWRRRFGDLSSRRYLLAFGAAIVMMIGARLAHGSTVEHGIQGLAQFAISSLIFIVSFAVASALTARALYGRFAS